MRIFSQSAIDGVGLAILKKGPFLGTLAVTIIAAVLLFQLEEKYKFKPAGVAAVVVFLIGLFVAFFAVPSVIERMKQDKAIFLREAIAHTFYSYVMLASFLPLVGPYIGRALESKKSKNPFIV